MNDAPNVPNAPNAPPAAGRTTRRALLGLAALAAAVGGALLARRFMPETPTLPVTEVAAVYGEPRAIPEFALIAHDGSPLDRTRLRGRYTFVLFGYTNCPDVCPTTLVELAGVKRLLAASTPPPGVLLVSVDPERDTPARLAAYVAHFDPAFVGATGAPAALEVLTRALGAVVARGAERDGNYSVDHTAALFLVDPEARIAAVFPSPHRAATIASDYTRIVAASAGARP